MHLVIQRMNNELKFIIAIMQILFKLNKTDGSGVFLSCFLLLYGLIKNTKETVNFVEGNIVYFNTNQLNDLN